MSEFPVEKIGDLLQTVQVTTVGAAAIQVGVPIPAGHVRKIMRMSAPSVNAGDAGFTVRQGDATAIGETVLDTINLVDNNPDLRDQSNDARLPLYTIRPDETRPDLVVPDEVNDRLSVQRVLAVDVTVSFTFYDERA